MRRTVRLPLLGAACAAIGFETTVFGMLYNKDKVRTAPPSWSVLWNPDAKGKVTTFDYQWEALMLAAKLNGGSASKIEPGFKVWSQHAGNFKALVNSNDQLQNLLVSGDAYDAPWFSAIAHDWMTAGAPLGFTIPKEGAIAFPTYLAAIAKNDAAWRQRWDQDVKSRMG
jgi:putative spermidine/putrescine transport system substrate-binding protein